MSTPAQGWTSYSSRLLWAMHQSGKTNQSELARAIGVKPQSIQYLCNLESGAQGSIHTPALARLLGVDAEWLARGEGQPVSSAQQLADRAPGVYGRHPSGWAPVLGAIRVDADGEPVHWQAADSSALKYVKSFEDELPGGGWRALRVHGNGLAPYAKDGQYVLLYPKGVHQPQLEDHVWLTMVDGRSWVMAFMGTRDDSWLLLPLRGGQVRSLRASELASVETIACVLPSHWQQR